MYRRRRLCAKKRTSFWHSLDTVELAGNVRFEKSGIRSWQMLRRDTYSDDVVAVELQRESGIDKDDGKEEEEEKGRHDMEGAAVSMSLICTLSSRISLSATGVGEERPLMSILLPLNDSAYAVTSLSVETLRAAAWRTETANCSGSPSPSSSSWRFPSVSVGSCAASAAASSLRPPSPSLVLGDLRGDGRRGTADGGRRCGHHLDVDSDARRLKNGG